MASYNRISSQQPEIAEEIDIADAEHSSPVNYSLRASRLDPAAEPVVDASSEPLLVERIYRDAPQQVPLVNATTKWPQTAHSNWPSTLYRSPDSIPDDPDYYAAEDPREKSDTRADVEAVPNNKSNEPERRSAFRLSLVQEIAFIAVIVTSQFLSLAGLGQALAPRQLIAQSFSDTTIPDQAWFSAAYSLTAGTFILVSGRIGDIIGHKRMLVSGFAVLGIWSGFAGFSAYMHRQTFFEVCRAFQGIGSAMIIPNALALLGRAYEKGVKKNLVFALFGAMAPWGAMAGFFFGSLFAEKAWWPWAFWSYGFAALGLAVLALLAIPTSIGQLPLDEKKSQVVNPSMDWPGSILGVIGLVLFNIAWNNGPLFGWGRPDVYVILIFGILTLVLFCWVETRAECPILPLGSINWTVGFTLLLLSLGWGSFSIWLYYDWRFLEELRGYSPLAVTAQCAPVLVCGLLAAGATGFLMTNAPVSFTMMLAMFAFFTGEVITAATPLHQSYWGQTFVSMIIMPFGMDMSFPAASVIISNQMPPEHQGLAASLIVTVVNYSISIALGFAGTVESQVSPFSLTATLDENERGIRAALWTAVGLSGCGAVLGALFFIFTMRHFLKQV